MFLGQKQFLFMELLLPKEEFCLEYGQGAQTRSIEKGVPGYRTLLSFSSININYFIKCTNKVCSD